MPIEDYAIIAKIKGPPPPPPVRGRGPRSKWTTHPRRATYPTPSPRPPSSCDTVAPKKKSLPPDLIDSPSIILPDSNAESPSQDVAFYQQALNSAELQAVFAKIAHFERIVPQWESDEESTKDFLKKTTMVTAEKIKQGPTKALIKKCKEEFRDALEELTQLMTGLADQEEKTRETGEEREATTWEVIALVDGPLNFDLADCTLADEVFSQLTFHIGNIIDWRLRGCSPKMGGDAAPKYRKESEGRNMDQRCHPNRESVPQAYEKSAAKNEHFPRRFYIGSGSCLGRGGG